MIVKYKSEFYWQEVTVRENDSRAVVCFRRRSAVFDAGHGYHVDGHDGNVQCPPTWTDQLCRRYTVCLHFM